MTPNQNIEKWVGTQHFHPLLAGGFKYFSNFTPLVGGRWIQFDDGHIFSNGLVETTN